MTIKVEFTHIRAASELTDGLPSLVLPNGRVKRFPNHTASEVIDAFIEGYVAALPRVGGTISYFVDGVEHIRVG